MKYLFAPDCQDRDEIVVDETNAEVDGEEISVWAVVDRETLDVLHVGISASRSSLDALPFLKNVLKHFRGRPLVGADCGPWYDFLPPH